jgi:hypothetical protein
MGSTATGASVHWRDEGIDPSHYRSVWIVGMSLLGIKRLSDYSFSATSLANVHRLIGGGGPEGKVTHDATK